MSARPDKPRALPRASRPPCLPFLRPAPDLGKKFGVKGFPTLKYFPPNSLEPVDYTSGRDLDSLAAFITTQTGLKSTIKPPAPSLATILDVSNHDAIALDADKDVLVAYTAPWCGVRPLLPRVPLRSPGPIPAPLPPKARSLRLTASQDGRLRQNLQTPALQVAQARVREARGRLCERAVGCRRPV